MQFAAWSYLYLLALVPALLALYLYAFRRKRQALSLFMELALLPRLLPGYSRVRQWLKALCFVGAVACVMLALMQPQWGKRWQDVPRRGRDLMILLDVSLSMLAEDVQPNRLAAAKAAIEKLVHVIRQEGGHRLGLIVFAGRARLQCPLMLDYTFFLQRLRQVGPDVVEREGTLIGDAIRQALHGFGPVAPDYTDMILITDGEDHESFPLEAAKAAAMQKVSLYTIGVGDAANGTRVPLRDAAGRRAYAQYQGQDVRSRMQPALLVEMARLTGGTFVPAGAGAMKLDRIYIKTIAPKSRRDIEVTSHEGFVHQYHWFVLTALGLLLTDMLMRERGMTDRNS